MAKQCAFCPATADITGEHLWSDWMNDVIRPIVGQFRFTMVDQNDAVKKQFLKRSLDIKVPVVCAACNNQWMSDLENEHAKPVMKDMILSDKGRLLTPEQIRSIATFAFKCLVIADHTSLDTREGPFFPEDVRYAFAKSLTIPPGIQLWLSTIEEQGHGLFRGMYHKSGIDANPRMEIYSLTFGANLLIFQVTAFRWLDDKQSGLIGKLTQHSYWDKFSIPAWPNPTNASILWPAKPLFLGSLAPFCFRWKNLNFTSRPPRHFRPHR